MILSESTELSEGKTVFEVQTSTKIGSRTSPGMYLVNWESQSDLTHRAARLLDEKDTGLLSNHQQRGQAYVIRMIPDQREVWLIGAAPQGVLYAAATLLQLMEPTGSGVGIREAHIRDYPDFPYRASSDWLLRAELHRWAYDWGDGRCAFVRRIKRKLDFCLRYKINMVVFDGFGWNSEKVPGYARMMRDLNAYAAERGITLIFGGFWANYDPNKVQPQHNIGTVFYNREGYPWGAIYPCFGEARTPEHPTLGTCRSNDALNELKLKEIETFVRSVEPGALYIHHEDTGWFVRTQERWLARCPSCKTRWPDDDLTSVNGGAGALAYGYTMLLETIFSVKNPDTGYDASRACTVILVSPVYAVDQDVEGDWDRVLNLWATVLSLLPDRGNIQVCFRETFPHRTTGQSWVDAYTQRMASEGLNADTFLFFLGGADHYTRGSFNYPFVATAAMNGIFKGATALYNFSGGHHQEPLQMLNAEFAWNIHAPEYRLPTTYEETKQTWESLMYLRTLPEGIFSTNGFLGHACRRLYGNTAGECVHRYFTAYLTQPCVSDELLVPTLPEKLFPLSTLWRILALDQPYWEPQADNPAVGQLLERLRITYAEWQQRLGRVWALYAEITTKGQQHVNEAMSCPDLREDAREDLEYLSRCLEVGKHFADLLSHYHEMLSHDTSDPAFATSLQMSEESSRRLSACLDTNFTFDTVCPLGGDQSSWVEAALSLRNSLQILRQTSMEAVQEG
jgi:hypothetical protein